MKKNKEKNIELQFPEFWIKKPFANMTGKEGITPNAIVVYSKTPWERKVLGTMSFVSVYAHKLYIDLWIISFTVKWTKRVKY